MNFDLLGICFDKTQICRKGAAKAPLLIRSIFPKLETFVSGIDLTERAFLNDLGNIKPGSIDSMIRGTRAKLENTKNFPIILGGEHTISIAGIKALPKIKSFVSFDAHPDCENTEKHDGAVRNIAKAVGKKNIYLYGVRCCSKEESEFLKKKKVNVIKNLSGLKKIPAPVYLSIDFDILDPSIFQAVGNPEPDGLKFKEVMEAVKVLAPKLAAVDFVEFTPLGVRELDGIYAMIAGKMIYASIAEIIRARE